MAPMLVPTTMSTGMPASSITLSAPTWAAPFAPPPLRTIATLGRPFLFISEGAGVFALIVDCVKNNKVVNKISTFFIRFRS